MTNACSEETLPNHGTSIAIGPSMLASLVCAEKLGCPGVANQHRVAKIIMARREVIPIEGHSDSALVSARGVSRRGGLRPSAPILPSNPR
jgi:hypothetical protein